MRSEVRGLEIPGVLWRRDPHGTALPLVLDSPHSGSDYPDDFGFACALDALRRVEDTYVDELWGAAPEFGAQRKGRPRRVAYPWRSQSRSWRRPSLPAHA